MKKKFLYPVLALFLTILCCSAVLADAAFDYYPDDTYADYDIIVSAPDGGCNFRQP